MKEEKIEFSDRYGGNYPDPETMCQGPCEGMGVVPIKKGDEDFEEYREKWEAAELLHPDPSGWHFVTCNDCNGTGKKPQQ